MSVPLLSLRAMLDFLVTVLVALFVNSRAAVLSCSNPRAKSCGGTSFPVVSRSKALFASAQQGPGSRPSPKLHDDADFAGAAGNFQEVRPR